MSQSIEAKIIKISTQSKRIKEFRLAEISGGSLPDYEPGAHIRVLLPEHDYRCYSLIEFAHNSEAPNEYRIAVQLEPEGEGGSRHMHDLAEGDVITIEPPRNDFAMNEKSPAILLAGGIGVTPMISMATKLKAIDQDFEFHYAGRSVEVMAYCDELSSAFGNQLHLHFDDDPKTSLNLEQLVQELPDTHHLYFCGPPGMLVATKTIAGAAGVAAERIHFEVFSTPSSQDDDEPFEVELASDGQVFTIPVGQTIVEVLDKAGVDIMFDCQRGDCGICQTDIVSGEPDHRDMVLSDDEKASGKIMQICVSRAKSARLVLDI